MEDGPADSRMTIPRGLSHTFLFIVTMAAFAILSLIGVLRHEMWRDELAMWLVARDTGSLAQLLQILHYGGHPPLWYFILRVLSFTWSNPAAMQYFCWALAVANACLFLRFAPFSFAQRCCFIFGYFPFYEYCVKARSYVLDVSFLFLLCIIFPKRHRRYIAISAILCLLCLTSVFGLLIALSFAVCLAADYYRSGERQKDRAGFWWGAGIFLAGFAVTVIQLIPPHDSFFAVSWYFEPYRTRLLTALTALRIGFFPSAAWMFEWRFDLKNALLGLCVLAVTLITFPLPRKLPAFIYGSGIAFIAVFIYVKHSGYIWHHGHIWLLYVCSLWIAYQYRGLRRSGVLFLNILLMWHMVAGFQAMANDWKRPYSNGRAAAQFISRHSLDTMPMFGYQDTAVVSVLGYLRNKAYYPQTGRFGTYYLLNGQRKRTLTQEEIIGSAFVLSARGKSDLLMILNEPLEDKFTAGPVKEIARFTGALWKDEDFYLYLMPANSSTLRAARRI